MAKKRKQSMLTRLIKLIITVFIVLFAYFLITGNDFGLGINEKGTINIFESGNQEVVEIIVAGDEVSFDGTVLTIDELETKLMDIDTETIKLVDQGATNKTYNEVVELLNKYNIVY
jgi:hypothetical protein